MIDMVAVLRDAVKHPNSFDDFTAINCPNKATPDVSIEQAVHYALGVLNTEARRLIKQVKELPADSVHRGVIHRYRHLIEMLDKVPKTAAREGFDQDQQRLSGLVAFAHDLGRFEEALSRFSSESATISKRGTQPHAELSLDIIDRTHSLKFFSPEIAEAIRHSVLFHAAKDVDQDILPKGSLGRQLCYLIRDDDKLDILIDEISEYVTPQGIALCFVRHFLKFWVPDPQTALNQVGGLGAIEKMVEGSLARSGLDPSGAPTKFEQGSIEQVVDHFINAPPYEPALQDFLAGQQMSTNDIHRSQSTYWLCQLAIIGDLEFDSTRDQVRSSEAVNKRLELLRPRLTAEQYEDVVKVVEKHLRASDKL